MFPTAPAWPRSGALAGEPGPFHQTWTPRVWGLSGEQMAGMALGVECVPRSLPVFL